MAISQANAVNEIAWGLSNAERLMIDKASVATQIAGGVCSLWRATGIPGQGAIPTTAAVCSKALLGAMGFTNQVGPVKAYMAYAWASAQNAGYAPLVHDRLAHMGGLNGTLTTSQVCGVDITLPTSNLPARIGAADYSDCNWWLEWYTATGATVSNATCAVVYNDGTTGNVVVSVPASTAASRMLPIVSAVTGKFIRSITTVQLSASTATAGNFGVTATRERLVMPTDNIAYKRREFTWAQLGMNAVANDACLFPMVDTLTTSSGIIRSQIKMIYV